MELSEISTPQVIKFVAGSFVGAGVSKIVHDVIAQNTTPEKAIEKITVGAASVVIGMMAKDAAKEYVSTKIDRYAETWNNIKQKAKTIEEETRPDTPSAESE
jgi:hypothetical protein